MHTTKLVVDVPRGGSFGSCSAWGHMTSSIMDFMVGENYGLWEITHSGNSHSRSRHWKCFISSEKILELWEILQNSQENTCDRVSFLRRLQTWVLQLRPATLLEKRFWHRCFPANFAKFLRTPFYRTPLSKCFCHSSPTHIYYYIRYDAFT